MQAAKDELIFIVLLQIEIMGATPNINIFYMKDHNILPSKTVVAGFPSPLYV